MSIDFGNDGYDYTRDLCHAIEAYTANAVKRWPDAFIYRGMDLRYAVERLLYIKCINSVGLFRYYLVQRAAKELTPIQPDLSRLELEISSFLPGARAAVDRVRSGIGAVLHYASRRSYGWLRSRYRMWRDEKDSCVRDNVILIHVGNAKFAAYLSSVTQKLKDGTYAYLAACDYDLGTRLQQSGKLVVRRPTAGLSMRSILHSPALFEFGQLMYEADTTFEAIQILLPQSVLVVEGNAPLDVITAEACRVLDIPCFCVQQGWSPYIHSGFRNMAYTEMFVWGARFAELLRPHNPNLKLRVTGNHVVQVIASSRMKKSDERIFSFFLQAPCALLGVASYNAFIDLIAEVAEAHPQVCFVVREHPGYPLPVASRDKLATCSNVSLSAPTTEQLVDVLAQSEMVVSVFSTVLLEAMALNIVPLICSIGPMKRYEPDIASRGAAIEVNSMAEARCVIDDVIADPERLSPMRKKLSDIADQYFQQGDAAELIAARLREAGEPSFKGNLRKLELRRQRGWFSL